MSLVLSTVLRPRVDLGYGTNKMPEGTPITSCPNQCKTPAGSLDVRCPFGRTHLRPQQALPVRMKTHCAGRILSELRRRVGARDPPGRHGMLSSSTLSWARDAGSRAASTQGLTKELARPEGSGH